MSQDFPLKPKSCFHLITRKSRVLTAPGLSGARIYYTGTPALFERFWLNGDVLLAFFPLLPIFLHPSFVALAGGGVAASKREAAYLRIRNRGPVVAGREH